MTALEHVLRRMNIIRGGNTHQFEELWYHLDKDGGGTISIQEFGSRQELHHAKYTFTHAASMLGKQMTTLLKF